MNFANPKALECSSFSRSTLASSSVFRQWAALAGCGSVATPLDPAMWWATCIASMPTPARLPETIVYSQCSPRKYRPGNCDTPRSCMG